MKNNDIRSSNWRDNHAVEIYYDHRRMELVTQHGKNKEHVLLLSDHEHNKHDKHWYGKQLDSWLERVHDYERFGPIKWMQEHHEESLIDPGSIIIGIDVATGKDYSRWW